eukprot:TRINITY_DN44154_c0_g1_i1.p1 TRINITY_DN44154_c0_g1~~TRINITY_DN44154_c0_g1_i1.p1  ORF type:complete len:294 (-),score=75.80 TRINITY_DN44154_c0_g1_i1:69-950(-)
MSKVAIVTGSNSGVGKETACQLAGKGFHVVFACRSKERAEEAMKHVQSQHSGAKTTFLEFDTGKMKVVKAFAKAFLAQFDRLDVLVHNAGRGYFLKDERVTEDGLEAFFQTNYLGAFMLTKLLTDVIKKSQGRVICVTSIEHWEGSYNFEKTTSKTGALSYATSKLMMCLFAFELMRREGIETAAVNPGGVMSGIWWYLRGWKAQVWNMLAPKFLLSCEQGAATSVYAATVDTLPRKPIYLSPYKQWGMCPKRSDTLNFFSGAVWASPDPKVYNEENWKKLWDFSEEKIKPFL